MLQVPQPKLILASGSLTRLTLLRDAGIVVEAHPVDLDEASVKQAARIEEADARDTALLLADLKARRCVVADAVVIAADQMLECEGTWFDKPVDRDAAKVQLRELCGRTHFLHSAVCCWRDGERLWQHLATARLQMRDFSEEFLDAYLDAEGPRVLGSVGAYRLEGPGVQLFERIDGDHSTILGLPLLPLLKFLRGLGVLGR